MRASVPFSFTNPLDLPQSGHSLPRRLVIPLTKYTLPHTGQLNAMLLPFQSTKRPTLPLISALVSIWLLQNYIMAKSRLFSRDQPLIQRNRLLGDRRPAENFFHARAAGVAKAPALF